MKKQINKRWQSLLLATIATFIVLGTSGSVFAQNKAADKYPKPDFSAMEEYWEVVESEYDFSTNIPTLNITAKPKQKVVPTWWTITWRDAKGVAIHKDTLMFNYTQVSNAKIGEPIIGSSYAPFKKRMSEVKSVKVTDDQADNHEVKTAN